MAIICITAEGLPGIRPCTIPDVHKITCLDHPGWVENPGHCGGCFPREAHRGFLCDRCYDRVVGAYMNWDRFASALRGVDRAVQHDNAGIRTQADGHIPLPGTMLALDECWRFLRTLGTGPRALDMWVSSMEGAADAVQFAHAAERAYRTHEIEERETKLRRVRCAACGQLSFTRRPPSHERAAVTVTCQNPVCGKTIREGDTTTDYTRNHDGGWAPVTVEKIDVIATIETRRAG